MTPEQKARIEEEAKQYYFANDEEDKVIANAERRAYVHGATKYAAKLDEVNAELERVEKSHYETMTKNDVKIQQLESDLAAARKEIEELKKENDDLYGSVLTLLDEHESLCREIKAQIQQQRKGK